MRPPAMVRPHFAAARKTIIAPDALVSAGRQIPGPQIAPSMLIGIKFCSALGATLPSSGTLPRGPNRLDTKPGKALKRAELTRGRPTRPVRFGSRDGLQPIFQCRPQPPA